MRGKPNVIGEKYENHSFYPLFSSFFPKPDYPSFPRGGSSKVYVPENFMSRQFNRDVLIVINSLDYFELNAIIFPEMVDMPLPIHGPEMKI